MYIPGDSVKKKYTITNLSTGDAVDLDSISNVIVHLKTTNQKVIKKLSLNTQAGYSDLPVIDPAINGQVRVVLNSSETEDLANREVYIEFKIQETDIDYTDANGGISISDSLFAEFTGKKSTTDVSL
jgi:hypothetical protein